MVGVKDHLQLFLRSFNILSNTLLHNITLEKRKWMRKELLQFRFARFRIEKQIIDGKHV